MEADLPDGPQSGTLGWSCPSNIALVKYWGKRPGQLPMNPSLSMTLQEARTSTSITYAYEPGKREGEFRFRFEGREEADFQKRIAAYLKELEPLLPFLSRTRLDMDSANTFPHSSGIASSASAMGALALCLVQLEEELLGPVDREFFWQKASRLARLGSGSASRSIFPQFVLWGQHPMWDSSSDDYAIPVQGIDETFLHMRDTILVVHSGPKKVSSSLGHTLMDSNPFGKVRFQQARENLERLHRAMTEGDWNSFIAIVEEEALTLHAMMMTSRPGYLLMQADTLSILHLVREYREETGIRVGFTLDAGANVHLLYARDDTPQVDAFISTELLKYCENGLVIRDRMGQGPQKIEQ